MPTVNCPKCDAGYEVPAAKLGAAGRKLKCAKCGEIWLATLPTVAVAEPTETPVATASVNEDAPPPVSPAQPDLEPALPELSPPEVLTDLAQLESWGGWGKLWRGENRWLTAAATLGMVGLAVGGWLGWQQWAPGPQAVAAVAPVHHDAVMVKPPAGVLLNNVEAEVVQANGKDGQVAGMTLKVRGEVHNTGEALVELPQLALELVGLDGAMLDRVRVGELPELLGAGDERTWAVSVTAPTLTEVPAWRVVWLGAPSATTVSTLMETAGVH
jgi:predicted Zn finger-like uncharacterized protein